MNSPFGLGLFEPTFSSATCKHYEGALLRPALAFASRNGLLRQASQIAVLTLAETASKIKQMISDVNPFDAEHPLLFGSSAGMLTDSR